MRILLIFIISFSLCPQAYARTCIAPLPKVSLFEVLWENDVIFVGKRLSKTNINQPSKFEVISVLKGLPISTKEIDVYERYHEYISGEPVAALGKKELMIYAQYKDGEIKKTNYPFCTKLPDTRKIIFFAKYKFIILAIILFLGFSIYRIGGFRAFISTDIMSLIKVICCLQSRDKNVAVPVLRYWKISIFILLTILLVMILAFMTGEQLLFSYYYKKMFS